MDAGSPSGKPTAKRRLVPVDHAVVKTVLQAQQTLLFVEQETEDAIADIGTEVGVRPIPCVSTM